MRKGLKYLRFMYSRVNKYVYVLLIIMVDNTQYLFIDIIIFVNIDLFGFNKHI
jgi:hypothetical protein